MIAHHIVAQVSLVRVISWSSHDERISSTLSSPFPSTSSSSHSSLTSCTSSCTSSTALRAVATLRTSPERRWTQLTNPTSSQITDATREGCQALLDAVWPPQVRAQGAGHRTQDRTSLLRGRGVCPTERVPQGHECQRARPGFKKHRRPCPRVALLWCDNISGECTVWSTPLTATTETGLRRQTKNSSKCRTRTRCAMRRCWFSINKQDMLDAVTAAKVIEKLGLHNLRKRE